MGTPQTLITMTISMSDTEDQHGMGGAEARKSTVTAEHLLNSFQQRGNFLINDILSDDESAQDLSNAARGEVSEEDTSTEEDEEDESKNTSGKPAS